MKMHDEKYGVYRYYCPHCGEELTGYSDDGITVECTECGKNLTIAGLIPVVEEE